MERIPAFGARLRARMAELEVSCEQVSERTGVSLATVYRWRKGSQPSLAQASALAELLGMTVDDLCAPQGVEPAATGTTGA